jgi:hypothetical protein
VKSSGFTGEGERTSRSVALAVRSALRKWA